MTTNTTIPVLVNGTPEDRVSSLDRGLLYGDGLFETIAVVGGRPRFWLRHMARLQAGCERLGIPCPDTDSLAGEAQGLLQDVERCVLKIIVTRGTGGRGYRPPADPQPTRIVQRHPWPDYPASWREQGVRVRLCEQRLVQNPPLAGIKHLNRLEQVLARLEWEDPDIMEGLMADGQGNLVEGTMCNLFIVQDQQLVTPDLGRCGVNGIVRAVLMELAGELGLPVVVRDLTLTTLQEADEVFLTNSVIGIWPVRQLADHSWPRGAVTQQLQERLAALREGDDG
ncbi:MAG: aminodeoxychorismate lyase [Gammaproteobacteria bacterium]|nr:aminodeoxychorismate lyase [Gammaproteobacteria bacterium]